MNIKERYALNKAAKVRDKLICPSCGTHFTKENYQQAFCKNKPKTQCKDKYWNMVDESKRNNTTRISPANAAYMNKKAYYDGFEDRDEMGNYYGLGATPEYDALQEGWDGHKD